MWIAAPTRVFDVNEVVTVAAWVKVAAFDRNHQSIVTKGDSAWGLCRNRQSDRLRFVFGGRERVGNLARPDWRDVRERPEVASRRRRL